MTPVSPPTVVGDIGGGALYLVVGMVSAMFAATRNGQGTVVDAAITDGAAHMQNLLLSISGGMKAGDSADANPLVGAHWSRTYRCADGRYMSVQCLEPKFYQIFLARMGLEKDDDFAANQFDRSAWSRLSAHLADLFATQPSGYWSDLFAGSDACVAPVLSPREAAGHPHNAARGTWHMTGDELQAAAAPRFAGRHPGPPNPIPERGQDSAAILSALATGSGWDTDA